MTLVSQNNLNTLNPFEAYTKEMTFSLFSCLGFFLVKKLKNLTSTQGEEMKAKKQKLLTSLERWGYANSISEYNALINSTNEKTDPLSLLKVMLDKEVTPTIDTYNALLLNCYQTGNDKDTSLLKKEILDKTGPVVPNSYTLNILIKGLNRKYLNLKKENKLIYENQVIGKKFDENTDTSDNSESSSSDSSGDEKKDPEAKKTEKAEKEKKKIAVYKTDMELNNLFDEELVEIIQTLESLNIFMDIFTQNTILESLVEQRRIEEAWNQYANMKTFFVPDFATYKFMLRGIKKCKVNKEKENQKTKDNSNIWLERAIEILNESKQIFELDEVFLNSMLEVCVKFSLEKAEVLFDEMKTVKKSKEIVTEYTYALMIKAYGNSNQLRSAIDVFKELKELFPNITGNKENNIIIKYENDESNEEKDGNSKEDLLQKENPVNITLTSLSYAKIIKACIQNKEIQLAEHFYNEMEILQIPKSITVYSTMLNGYRVTKNLPKALNLYEEAKSNANIEFTSAFYNSLIDLCLDTCNNDKINEVYLDFKFRAQESDSNQDVQPDMSTYIMLLKGYAKLGNFTKVQDIYYFLKKRLACGQNDEFKLNTDTYSQIFRCYCLHGDENSVKELWKEIKVSKGVKLNVNLFASMIKFYCRVGNFNKAFEILEECIRINLKPGISIYYMIIESQIQANFIDRAITLFRNMLLNKQMNGDYSVHELILKGCVKLERSEEAFEFALMSMKDKLPITNELYNDVLSIYIQNDELKPYERKEGLIRFLTSARENQLDFEVLDITLNKLTNFLNTKRIFIFDEKFLYEKFDKFDNFEMQGCGYEKQNSYYNNNANNEFYNEKPNNNNYHVNDKYNNENWYNTNITVSDINAFTNTEGFYSNKSNKVNSSFYDNNQYNNNSSTQPIKNKNTNSIYDSYNNYHNNNYNINPAFGRSHSNLYHGNDNSFYKNIPNNDSNNLYPQKSTDNPKVENSNRFVKSSAYQEGNFDGGGYNKYNNYNNYNNYNHGNKNKNDRNFNNNQGNQGNKDYQGYQGNQGNNFKNNNNSHNNNKKHKPKNNGLAGKSLYGK